MKILEIFGVDPNAGKSQVVEVLESLPKTSSETVTNNVINTIFYATGIIAVVMIIISGIQMTSSAGNPSAVAKAKATLVAAIVGLAIVILAYAIVNFVLTTLTNG
ncbi:hypothetical protein IKE71_01160 [Candidatus Saccharibacteria bacterium]|nr:hypothetical protein [Candidatus Saccharibacteria bacterium]